MTEERLAMFEAIDAEARARDFRVDDVIVQNDLVCSPSDLRFVARGRVFEVFGPPGVRGTACISSTHYPVRLRLCPISDEDAAAAVAEYTV